MLPVFETWDRQDQLEVGHKMAVRSALIEGGAAVVCPIMALVFDTWKDKAVDRGHGKQRRGEENA